MKSYSDEFYSYDIKSNGKRVAYNLDCDARFVGKFCGYDIAELLMEMADEGQTEVTLTVTLRRYPEDEIVECSKTEEGC